MGLFNQKREALLLWHEHRDKKMLVGTLIQDMHQAVDGPKPFEAAMKLNMKLGPRRELQISGSRIAGRSGIPMSLDTFASSDTIPSRTTLWESRILPGVLSAPRVQCRRVDARSGR